MLIRPAKPEESTQLSELAQEAKRHWDYPEDSMDSWHSTMTLEGMHIDLSPPWVADDNGEVVGFYQLIADGDRMELEHLWVKPQNLQQGIGKQLLAHAVTTARSRGAKRISIDADANATAFYLSCGAYRVGNIPSANAGSGRAQQLLEIDLVGKA